MTERWRAEAEELARRLKVGRVVGMFIREVPFSNYADVPWDEGVDAILQLIERVQQETRQSIAAALADRVDILRGGDEDAVYAHAVSIALTEGAGAASPSGRCGALQVVAITCIPGRPNQCATATCNRARGHLASHEGEALGKRWWWNQHGHGILRGAADRVAAPPSRERQKEQCPYCNEWCAHGFCGRCERVIEPHQPDERGA